MQRSKTIISRLVFLILDVFFLELQRLHRNAARKLFIPLKTGTKNKASESWLANKIRNDFKGTTCLNRRKIYLMLMLASGE